MKFKDIQKKSTSDLVKELARLEFELMKHRGQSTTGGGKESGAIRTIKRDIAKIKTIQRKVEVTGKQ